MKKPLTENAFFVCGLALLPFVLLVGMFELAPLVSVVAKSFVSDASGMFGMDNYRTIFQKPFYIVAIKNSIWITLVSAVVGLVIAFFAAKASCDVGPRQKRVFMALLNMMSNFAGVPLAFAFIVLMGKSGILVLLGKQLQLPFFINYDLYTVSGLMMIYIYFQIPLATLLLIPAFDIVKPEWKEAALLLKASHMQFWFRIGIPSLLPAIFSVFSVLFANALSAYATAYALLSGNISLLPIRVSQMFTGDLVQRVGLGSALSVIMLILILTCFFVCNYFVARMAKKGAVCK